jgi:hypothetical protein
MLSQEQTDLLASWQAAKIAAANAVMNERDLRAKVIETFSTETDEMKSGVENIDLGFDKWELKITHAVDYKLADSDAVKMALAQIAASIEGGSIIADRLVKFKPELSASEYKLLNGGQRAIINRVLTIKPASKSIEIKQRSR